MFAKNLYHKFNYTLLELLYSKLAPTYDLVSYIISKGKWYKWQSYAINMIKGTKALEIGCGTGTLILRANEAGSSVIGLEKSRDMIHVCGRKFRKKFLIPIIIQGDILNAPIKSKIIESVIVTFPTNYLLELGFYCEVHRILIAGGRLIILDYPHFYKKSVVSSFFNFLVNFGDKRDLKDILNNLIDNRFEASVEEIKDSNSSVKLIIAEKLM